MEIVRNDAPKIFVLGNQKSGTTAIASLLGELCGLTTTIDIPRRWRSDGYSLVRGQITLNELVDKRPSLFRSAIVKIPPLTFVARELAAKFPNAKFVFVIRDPRENIRSILNRRKIPGNRLVVPIWKRLVFHLQNRPAFDPDIWGGGEDGYVGVLACRWNIAIDRLRELEGRVHIVKYEDFVSDKHRFLTELADNLGLKPKRDVFSRLDFQFQPPGNRNISWMEFFGKRNLGSIERICHERMVKYNYLNKT